jgi:hypothetical protein
MPLTTDQKIINRKIAQAKYRSKNKPKANLEAKLHHEANKKRRNTRKRFLYAQRKASKIASIALSDDFDDSYFRIKRSIIKAARNKHIEFIKAGVWKVPPIELQDTSKVVYF